MPVIHVCKTPHFARDRRLSYKARGLLAFILSHEHDWEVHVETLIKESDEDGRVSVQTALQELIKTGYATLELVRDVGGKVRGKSYFIYDTPGHASKHRQADNASVGADKQENRQSGNLLVGEKENDVVTIDDRQAGFTTDGFSDDRKTCSTKTQDLREKKDPPIVPPQGEPATETKRKKRYLPKEETVHKAMLRDFVNEAFRTWHQANHPEADIETQWEFFVRYCLSNGKQYIDFRAAFMNSFDWESSPAHRRKPYGKAREKTAEPSANPYAFKAVL